MAESEPSGESRVGQTLGGKYTLLRLLGGGGMGAVYEAVNSATGRRVALKVLHAELSTQRDTVARFRQEARAAAQLTHHNIVEVLDLDQHADGSFYLVQELLTGQDLRARLRASGRLSAREALELLLPVMDALVAAHARGVVHRDLKPENVFLSLTPGGAVVPKLIDFGIAKLLEPGEGTSKTRTGALLGTPQYMAPEQIRGDGTLDARVDVWAVGVLFYELLAGKNPFDAPTVHMVLLNVMHEPRAPLAERAPEVPTALAAVLERALERDREKRFASMRALLDAVLACADAEPSLAQVAWRFRESLPVSSLPGLPLSAPPEPAALPYAPTVGPSSANTSNPFVGPHASTVAAVPNPSLAEPAHTVAAPPRGGRGVGLGVLLGGLVLAGAVGVLALRREGRSGAGEAARPLPPPRVADSALAGRCVVTAPARAVGERVDPAADLTLVRDGDALGLGWSVPGRYEHGSGTPAMVLLSEQGAVLRAALAEAPDEARGNRETPVSVVRVVPVPTPHGLEPVQDRVERSSAGAFAVRCGRAEGLLREPGEAGPVVHAGVLFSCRTVAAPGGGFVVGLRSRAGTDALFADTADVVAGRRGSASSGLGLTGWTVPVQGARSSTAADPVASLRSQLLDGLVAARVPGVGYAVAFRFRERLRVGWLSEDLRAAREYDTVPTLGGRPGLPALATDGQRAALLFADRASAAGSEPYRLFGLLLEPRAHAGSPVRLALRDADAPGASSPLDEYAPSLAALPGGGWLLAWTRGLLVAPQGMPHPEREVRLARADAALTAVEPSARLNPEESGTDPELVATERGWLAAWLSGARAVPSLSVSAGRCEGALPQGAGARP